MKPQLLKISSNPNFSFSVRQDIVPNFFDKWHYHPEIELVHILNGTGTQFIGNDISRFGPDDMLLVGGDLPHLWRCDPEYYEGNEDLFAKANVLHFSPETLGSSFWQLAENKNFYLLLQKAKQGIIIKGEAKQKIASLMMQLLNSENEQRLILLLQILYCVYKNEDNKLIMPVIESKNWSEDIKESERLNNIYQYIFNNFQHRISLNEIARVAHISPHSFCRFFKSRTQKSFSTFLTEVRIHHACRLLSETDSPVSTVCYDSGFNNFSNFNRHFKLLIKKSPLQHRQLHQLIKEE